MINLPYILLSIYIITATTVGLYIFKTELESHKIHYQGMDDIPKDDKWTLIVLLILGLLAPITYPFFILFVVVLDPIIDSIYAFIKNIAKTRSLHLGSHLSNLKNWIFKTSKNLFYQFPKDTITLIKFTLKKDGGNENNE